MTKNDKSNVTVIIQKEHYNENIEKFYSKISIDPLWAFHSKLTRKVNAQVPFVLKQVNNFVSLEKELMLSKKNKN